jgi:hypothetical protein
LDSKKTFRYTLVTLFSLTQKKFLLITFALLLLIVCRAQAHQSAEQFYGVPALANFPQEEGVPANDNASALENVPKQTSGCVFKKKHFTLACAVREGYDDNLFTTETDRAASFYINMAGGITYAAESSRLQLSAALNGGVTYFYTRPSNKYDYTGALNLRGAYKLTQRLTINLSTKTAYIARTDLTIVGGTNRQNGDCIYSSTTVAGAYEWADKFSTDKKYNFAPFVYVHSSLNDSQRHIELTLSQSFRWLVLPKTTGGKSSSACSFYSGSYAARSHQRLWRLHGFCRSGKSSPLAGWKGHDSECQRGSKRPQEGYPPQAWRPDRSAAKFLVSLR